MEKIKCLDNGYVRYVDHFGSDERIVEAARMSKLNSKKRSSTESLIRYLYRNEHMSPFEMCEIIIEAKMPIVVARQWVRHRTANLNECSGRYSVLDCDFYLPEDNRFVKNSTVNKQGSDDITPIDNIDEIKAKMIKEQQLAKENYESYIANGLTNEIARLNLPLSAYTKWYWKSNLRNVFHFLRLRLSPEAQYEIRVFAEAIAKITKQLFPITYAAFEDYEFNSLKFSKQEIDIIKDSILEEFNKEELSKLLSIIKNKSENNNFGVSEAVNFENKIKKIIVGV